MSFTADMEPVFQGIAAAAQAAGFDAKRVKDIVGDYRITSRIIELIRSSCMVVVDLTHERPNVYFELGYARGLGKTVITTAREGTQVHFDVKDWTCTFYSDSRILERSLKERFLIERDIVSNIGTRHH
jgi:nucleoside 2-deoxyribosyltransferase